MGSVILNRVIELAETWPADLQDELAAIAADLDAAFRGGTYEASAEELAAIEFGIRAADAGDFATQDEIGALIEKYRPA